MAVLGALLAAALGAVLLLAGALKLAQPAPARISLSRLAGARRLDRRLASATVTVLGAAEVLLGAVLLVPGSGRVPVVVAAVLCTGFCGAVRRARRLGAACGCFGSLSVRVTGRAEWLRALGLAATAWGLVAVRVARPDLPGSPAGGVAGLALATLVVATTITNGGTGGWRVPGPIQRYRLLRRAQALEPVREVAGRMGPLPWHRATVRIQGRPARTVSIVVSAPGARLHIVLPPDGRPLVIGYRPDAVLTPVSRRSVPC